MFTHTSLQLTLLACLLLCIKHTICENTAIMYLQTEGIALSSAQHTILSFLHQHKIPIGGLPRSMRPIDGSTDGRQCRVAISTSSNDLECRISLEKIPIGSKCVAPCGCSGSSKWIQFTELNRLRRKDPNQWKVCQTCQQTFDYTDLTVDNGILGNVLSAALDNRDILRGCMIVCVLAVSYILSIPSLLLRFLTSNIFWQLYPRWSRLVHLPLVLKFWGGKILAVLVWEQYKAVETIALQQLVELESSLIEPHLVVEGQVSDEAGSDDNDAIDADVYEEENTEVIEGDEEDEGSDEDEVDDIEEGMEEDVEEEDVEEEDEV